MKYLLNSDDINNILEHWLGTPANSYRGSRYGEKNNRILFKEMSADVANEILDKLKEDVPIFTSFDSNVLQIYSEDIGHDKKRIYLSVGTLMIPIGTTTGDVNYTGDTVNVGAQ